MATTGEPSHSNSPSGLIDTSAEAPPTTRVQRLPRLSVRSQLAKRIKLYTTPELRFEYDESVERGDRLSRLIDAALKPRR